MPRTNASCARGQHENKCRFCRMSLMVGKQTGTAETPMTACGYKQTSSRPKSTSALPSTTDIFHGRYATPKDIALHLTPRPGTARTAGRGGPVMRWIWSASIPRLCFSPRPVPGRGYFTTQGQRSLPSHSPSVAASMSAQAASQGLRHAKAGATPVAAWLIAPGSRRPEPRARPRASTGRAFDRWRRSPGTACRR